MFFFSSRRRHTRYWRDWSSDVCSSDLAEREIKEEREEVRARKGARGKQPERHHRRGRAAFPQHEDRQERDPGRRGIGRASRRERVEISADGVLLKKKTTSCPLVPSPTT